MARNTEKVERGQLRNIANQMPVSGRAKRCVSAHHLLVQP
jgi:hypothetical protein